MCLQEISMYFITITTTTIVVLSIIGVVLPINLNKLKKPTKLFHYYLQISHLDQIFLVFFKQHSRFYYLFYCIFYLIQYSD